MIASLVLYALLGGADYGGGVWDLFAFGSRARGQRKLIAEAISPVWEANHVWLILVIVILFTAFPPAFAAIATALHIPITLLLIGIVLRGTAFTFRTYDIQRDDVQRRWSLVFSTASIITPILLGTILGAIASGTITVEDGAVTSGFFNSWLAPFPIAVGFFALALFAFLAAVYLTPGNATARVTGRLPNTRVVIGRCGRIARAHGFCSRKDRRADSACRHQSHGLGPRLTFLHRDLRAQRFLHTLDSTLPAGACFRGRTGDTYPAWVGVCAVSAPR